MGGGKHNVYLLRHLEFVFKIISYLNVWPLKSLIELK